MIDAAKFFERRKITTRKQIEIVDERFHRRIKPVLETKLNCQTFAQIACKKARRIKALHFMQNAFDMDSFDTEILRKQGNISTQITAFIQRICQSCCNKAISRGGKRQRDLLSDMFAQRYAACRYLINVVAAARTISLPGRGVPLSSQVDMRVIAATGIIWKDIFKRAIEC